jgi:hypothetical protein
MDFMSTVDSGSTTSGGLPFQHIEIPSSTSNPASPAAEQHPHATEDMDTTLSPVISVESSEKSEQTSTEQSTANATDTARPKEMHNSERLFFHGTWLTLENISSEGKYHSLPLIQHFICLHLSPPEFRSAQNLLHLLRDKTLALQLAEAYIGNSGISFRDYLPLYHEKLQSVSNQDQDGIIADHHWAVAAFEISFEALDREDILAVHYLEVCAFLQNENILFELMRKRSSQSWKLLHKTNSSM